MGAFLLGAFLPEAFLPEDFLLGALLPVAILLGAFLPRAFLLISLFVVWPKHGAYKYYIRRFCHILDPLPNKQNAYIIL